MITSSIDLIISPPRPIANRVIHVHIEGLRPLDGGGVMDPIDEWFITKLDPHYSTVMRVRMVAGEFLTEVPDPTIDQLIQYYSHQADLLNFMPERSEQDPTKYKNYRARWVTASVVVLLLSGTSINSMLQKRLGDLMVKRDKPAIQLLGRQQKELEDLTDILQDGGYYGRSIKTAVKGLDNPDTPDFGRLWAETDIFETDGEPIANTKQSFRRISDGKPLRSSRKAHFSR